MRLWEVLTPLREGNKRGPPGQMRASAVGSGWWRASQSHTLLHTARLASTVPRPPAGGHYRAPLPLPPSPTFSLVTSTTDTPVKSQPPHPHNNTKFKNRLFWNLFLYKKGTIYITFIKSFRIIKYNITLLQEFSSSCNYTSQKLPTESSHSSILSV